MDHDWSLLFLDHAATPYTLSVGYNDSLSGTNQTIYTAGYPGDKCLTARHPAHCRECSRDCSPTAVPTISEDHELGEQACAECHMQPHAPE